MPELKSCLEIIRKKEFRSKRIRKHKLENQNGKTTHLDDGLEAKHIKTISGNRSMIGKGGHVGRVRRGISGSRKMVAI